MTGRVVLKYILHFFIFAFCIGGVLLVVGNLFLHGSGAIKAARGAVAYELQKAPVSRDKDLYFNWWQAYEIGGNNDLWRATVVICVANESTADDCYNVRLERKKELKNWTVTSLTKM